MAVEKSAHSDALREALTDPAFDAIVARLMRAVDANQLRPDIDPKCIADVLIGSIFYHVLKQEPMSDSWVEGILHLTFAAFVEQ